MLKVTYPSNVKDFHRKYAQIFTAHFKTDAFESYISTPEFLSLGMSPDEILTADFGKLYKKIKVLDNFPAPFRKRTKTHFSYKKFQSAIANFFMDHSKEMNLDSCFFCNLDHVYAFEDKSDFLSWRDLVQRGEEADLLKIKGITAASARIIRESRGKIKSIDDLEISLQQKLYLSNMAARKSYNHFTLDHVLPKSEYPLFSLSLYNFVPCCYNCNSKFKRVLSFLRSDGTEYLSPTSNKFEFNEQVRFKVLLSHRSENPVNTGDIALYFSILQREREKGYQRYINLFKLNPRYAFHKHAALDLINKRKKYSDAQIDEISRITKIPAEKLKADIFGSDIFSNTLQNNPLSKFRKDIAFDIGLIKPV